jgi:pimeloyl-ACP methyl ester carboxylesterase
MNSAISGSDTIPALTGCKNHEVKNSLLDETYTFTVKVHDIDIAYKLLGTGDPIILIMGFGGSMNNWDTTLLKQLSLHNTTIIFDNRGIGHTSCGARNFSIYQFANDVAGLLDALQIRKASVLGFSMGGMIAQELVLHYPDKVNKLVLYSSYCGGNESSYTSNPEVIKLFSNLSGSSCNMLLSLASLMFPKKWRTENPNYCDLFDNPSSMVSTETILNQSRVFSEGRDNKRTKPTLIVTGAEDVLVPAINSSIFAERIRKSNLIQVVDCGHGLMYQLPEKFSSIVSTFLAN